MNIDTSTYIEAMKPRLKPLNRQTIVITGATSGIGLATARAAAARGAALVLVARNDQALKTVRHDLAGKGAQVEIVVADVGVQADVARVVQTAIAAFGGFDTWINNAGVGVYGALTDVAIDDHRRLFETDYWGVVYGSLVAVAHLRDRPGGGAVINIGGLLGEAPAPLQGAQSAAKHAVHAFTATLRMELARAKAPVSVTLIRPGAVDTPFADHARTYLDEAWPHKAPIHAAPLVAQTLLYAAEHPARELTIGGMTGAAALLAHMIPTVAEPLTTWLTPRLSRDRSGRAAAHRNNLHVAGQDLRERVWRPSVREQSIAVAAQMRPAATTGLMVAGVALAVTCFVLGRQIHRRARPRPAPARLRRS